MALDAQVQSELARLQPNIPFRYKTAYLHHTWAKTFYSRPELYIQPESLEEIQKIITLARRCRKRLVVVGYGHSPSDLTCTSSWMVNLDNFNSILEYDVDGVPGQVRFQAGLSLHDLNLKLASKGYTLPNLGSIDVQSVAGAISTGTHGSSLRHGLLSQSITSITLLLSNGQPVRCSPTVNLPLFRAALCSLGSLGIIVEMTLQATPDFNIHWTQTLVPISTILDSWPHTLWSEAEYTRVWWLPYLQRAVIWRATRTSSPPRAPETTFYGGKLGFYVYHNLLYLSHYVPRLLPWVEWFVFGMQYGFKPGRYSASAIEPARNGLKMDCLYSQFVNEWAIPLDKGPEAIRRLSAWINGDEEASGIPFSSKGIYVHCPVEVRVTDTRPPHHNAGFTTASPPPPSDPESSLHLDAHHNGVRPYLDPTLATGPTLYLNATLYRPYGLDPPCLAPYYRAFEYLMREMHGRPHWAKNFIFTDASYVAEVYGSDLTDFLRIRDECDPDGLFVGPWHRRALGDGTPVGAQSAVEREVGRERLGKSRGGWGDGVLWSGERLMKGIQGFVERDGDVRPVDPGVIGGVIGGGAGAEGNGDTKTPATSTSEESFDYMAKGEASVMGLQIGTEKGEK